MSDRIDRRSFLVRGAATGVGIAAIGSSGGLLAACSSGSGSTSSTSTGSHPNGISTATPKKGGQLVFGVDAEEKGFSTTQGTFDEVGLLYARTVFDPLMIIADDGTPQPYLAQSVTHNPDYTVWTITLRPNLVFHNGTPVRRHRPGLQFRAAAGIGSDRSGVHQLQQRRGHQPAHRDRHPEVAVGALRLLPGRRYRRTDRLCGRAGLAEVRQPDQSHRDRSLRLFGVDPERPLHRDQEPALLATRTSLPRQHHLQAHPRSRPAVRHLPVRRRRHHAHRYRQYHQAAASRHVLRVHRRLGPHRRRTGHGVSPAQSVQAALQQPQGAPGHGLCDQLGPVRGHHRRRGQPDLERTLHHHVPLLRVGQPISEVRPGEGHPTGQGGPAGDGQAGDGRPQPHARSTDHEDRRSTCSRSSRPSG